MGRVDLYELEVSDTGETYIVPNRLVVSQGDTLVFARNLSAYAACYGSPADLRVPVPLDNGGDLIRFENPQGTVIHEVDFTASLAVVPGRSWERSSDDDSTWCYADTASPSGDQGTPGTDNGVCPTGAADLVLGDVLITELMADPDNCADADAEYVELRVVNGPVDLTGTTLTIDASTTVLSGLDGVSDTRFVIARNATAFATCYGFSPDAEFNGQLVNGGSTVTLGFGGTTIDTVNQAALGGSTTGIALERADDDAARWCDAADDAGSGDLGTPGTANGTCALGLADLQPGDLEFVELMYDPTNCSDTDGEYFEIRNFSGETFDLQGLVVTDAQGNSATVTDTLVVGPDDRVLFGHANMDTCYGFPYSLSVPFVQFNFALNNGGDILTLFAGSTVVDTVNYTSVVGGGVDQPNRSIEWDDPTHAYICPADGLMPNGTDHGTPGTANGLCKSDYDGDYTGTDFYTEFDYGGINLPCPGTVTASYDAWKVWPLTGQIVCNAGGVPLQYNIRAQFDEGGSPEVFGKLWITGMQPVDGDDWTGTLTHHGASVDDGGSYTFTGLIPGGEFSVDTTWSATKD